MAPPPERIRKYMRLSTVGLEMGFSVLIGLFVGQYLDEQFGTEPWLLLLFLLFGAAAGFRSLYRLLLSASADAKQQSKKPTDDKH